jgi:hypothetical protein
MRSAGSIGATCDQKPLWRLLKFIFAGGGKIDKEKKWEKR